MKFLQNKIKTKELNFSLKIPCFFEQFIKALPNEKFKKLSILFCIFKLSVSCYNRAVVFEIDNSQRKKL